MAMHGITNVFRAYYIIGSSAFCHFEQFERSLRQMRKVELGIWMQIVSKAIRKGEIEDTVARLFMNIYYGHAGSALRGEKSGDLQMLHRELLTLYGFVKKRRPGGPGQMAASKISGTINAKTSPSTRAPLPARCRR